ncbi:hypothetical protein [Vibrio sp. 1CM23M]|uniref:hypothetical protein n=1 Tax=Vibrio sp. 1CM23M TaxID=2929164 RepID=UPI0020C18184|nr:hypothetical protein [Vibrio sp. 1CM23M]MCK8072442.1 hypothetical protein [Vibrio sp. 1CM23M]
MIKKEFELGEVKQSIRDVNDFFSVSDDHLGVKIGLTVENLLVVLNYSHVDNLKILKLKNDKQKQHVFKCAKIENYKKVIDKIGCLKDLKLIDGISISKNLVVQLDHNANINSSENYDIDFDDSDLEEQTDIEDILDKKKKSESIVKKNLKAKELDNECNVASLVEDIQGRFFLLKKDWLFHYKKRKVKTDFFPVEVYINPQEKLLDELETRLPDAKNQQVKKTLLPLIRNNNTIKLNISDGCITKLSVLNDKHKTVNVPIRDEVLEPIIKYFNETEDKGIYIDNLQVSKNFARAMFSGATNINLKQDFPNIEADTGINNIFVKYGLVNVSGVPFLPLLSREIFMNFETHCGFMGRSLLKAENILYNPNYTKLSQIYANAILGHNIDLRSEGVSPKDQLDFKKELMIKLTQVVNNYYDKSLKYDLLVKDD